ncbi:M48 family metalloprotease [Candidatus Xenohaliotis californiensis]
MDLAVGRKILFFIHILFIIFSHNIHANFIRDEEIESFLHSIVDSLSAVALPDDMKIDVLMVNDPSFNAFVLGGNTIYINSGVFAKVMNCDQLAAILAHELAHIKLGHVARMSEQIRDAKKLLMLVYAGTTLLAVANKGNSMDSAAALWYGGGHMVQANILHHSRTNEAAADMNAVDYMLSTGYNPGEFINLLQVMTKNDSLSSTMNSYLSTHPMNRERLEYIKSYFDSRDLPDRHFNKQFNNKEKEHVFHKIKAKIEAFTGNIDIVKRKYSNDTCISKYAMSIVNYREGSVKEALDYLDLLLNSCYKNDPYIYELKGNLFYSIGNVNKSKENYLTALQVLNSDAFLIKMELAEALKSSSNLDNLDLAIEKLLGVIAIDADNANAWYLLGEVYYNKGDKIDSYIALAEYSLLLNKREMVKHYINLAKKHNNGSNDYDVRINEIEILLHNI